MAFLHMGRSDVDMNILGPHTLRKHSFFVFAKGLAAWRSLCRNHFGSYVFAESFCNVVDICDTHHGLLDAFWPPTPDFVVSSSPDFVWPKIGHNNYAHSISYVGDTCQIQAPFRNKRSFSFSYCNIDDGAMSR